MSIAALQLRIGEPIGTSPWLTIDQTRIDAFAQATSDMDWMHVDPQRAREGPVGTTIGQGFLTLSLLLHFSHQIGYLPPDLAHAFNYGLNKVRWLCPVKVGRRIRNIVVLTAIEDRGDDRFLITTQNTVEIEGESRPAMIAEWLGLIQLGDHPNPALPAEATA